MTTERELETEPPEGAGALDDPGLLSFLPLLYLAWADGSLEPAELRWIDERVAAERGLAPALRSALRRWLDPQRPPAPARLQELLATIRGAAGSLLAAERLDLSTLGVELARRAGHTVSAPELEALQALEAALGVPGEEAARRILDQPGAALAPSARPSFDPGAMSRRLDGEHRELREQIRRMLAEPGFRPGPDFSRSIYRERVYAACRELAARGYGRLPYPVSCGGAADYGSFFAVFETLAYADLSQLVKFGVQFGLFGGSILQLGTARHHARYLRLVGSLRLPGCFAMTETGHGSNVHDLETTATYDAATHEFIVRTPHEGARKDYIGNAAVHARLATVFAQLQVGGEAHGVHAFLVPIRDERDHPLPGVRIEDCGEKLGLNGVDNGRLAFDDVRIPRDNLLDRFGQVSPEGVYASSIPSASRRFFTMLGTLIGGRLSVGLAAVSASKTALTIAVRYADRRRQFGPAGGGEVPVLDYLSLQRRLLPRLAATYALDLAFKDAVRLYLDWPVADRRELEGEIAGLKAIATWHATGTIQTCREACGGQGYLAVNRFAALKADTDVFTTFEGDNTVLLQLLGKSLLTGYRKQFGDMHLWGLMRYLAAQAEEAISDLNPIVTRLTDEDHLRDRAFFLAALSWRERRLVRTVARRIKRQIDAGVDSFQAANDCQDHLVEAARAHVERRVAERFAAAINGIAEPELRAVLETLLQLYALERIEADRGWFLEHGYLESGKAKAIRGLVSKLCRELRPDAVALVDSFAIPAVWLPAIAK
jgi:acyl-CoA oxidase